MDRSLAGLRQLLGIGNLFDVVPDAVIVGDASTGRVALWNRAAEQIFGYTSEQALGMPLEDIVPPELRASHATGLSSFHRHGPGDLINSQRLVEVPALRRDGERIWIELRLATLGPAGATPYAVAAIRDVTARRLAEAEAERQAAEAQRAAQVMRGVLAMVSHDLRTPMTGVVTAYETLRRHWDRLDAPKRDEVMSMAGRQAGRVLEMLDDLLELSRAESGELHPQPTELEVAQVVSDAVETSGVEVELDVSPTLRAYADPAHVYRVLVNLLTNAAKYGLPPIRLAAAPSDRTIQITVDDAGPGVPAHFQDRLFDPFSRATSDSGATGHGLGLAIAKLLTEANSGRIAYRPLQPGARFSVSLPVRPHRDTSARWEAG